MSSISLTVSAEQKGALVTLEAIRRVRGDLKLNTVLGVSNISFGLPCRPLISSTFFSMAMFAGLTAAIINPKEEPMMAAWRSAMVLLGRDLNAAAYIRAYKDSTGAFSVGSAQAKASAGTAAAVELPEGIRGRLAKAVIEGEQESVVELVEQALAEGLTPMEISNEALLKGLE